MDGIVTKNCAIGAKAYLKSTGPIGGIQSVKKQQGFFNYCNVISLSKRRIVYRMQKDLGNVTVLENNFSSISIEVKKCRCENNQRAWRPKKTDSLKRFNTVVQSIAQNGSGWNTFQAGICPAEFSKNMISEEEYQAGSLSAKQ